MRLGLAWRAQAPGIRRPAAAGRLCAAVQGGQQRRQLQHLQQLQVPLHLRPHRGACCTASKGSWSTRGVFHITAPRCTCHSSHLCLYLCLSNTCSVHCRELHLEASLEVAAAAVLVAVLVQQAFE